MTDANVLLGRLLPPHFPKIFGPNGDESLDTDVVRSKFDEIAHRINDDTGTQKSTEEIALGFLAVATETMCNPIRSLSEARGHETSSHRLAVFGGAGGQAACDVATSLGISRVLIHKSSSVLSAFGIARADVVHESQESFAGTTADTTGFTPRLNALQGLSESALTAQGFELSHLSAKRYLNMRYAGADATLMIPEPEDLEWAGAFKSAHQQEFGFSHPTRAVHVDDLRVRVVANEHVNASDSLSTQVARAQSHPTSAKSKQMIEVYFNGTGFVDSHVFELDGLATGVIVQGPAIIVDATQTIVVIPSSQALVTDAHVIIDLDTTQPTGAESELRIDPIQLSVFGHRFMAVSEQMGRALQKTAVSVNIKERMDFSCALFDPEGRLVANAPHVPGKPS